jgi:hypothetical protein
VLPKTAAMIGCDPEVEKVRAVQLGAVEQRAR